MSAGWAPKRFWSRSAVVPLDGGFGVTLDARDLRTPGRAQLVLPTRAMAEAIATEWDAQGDRIDPFQMPITRAANSAIDKVAVQRTEVVAHLAAYGDADLICYRAAAPAGLVARQATSWDPLLDYAASLGAPLRAVKGVMHAPQPPASLARLAALVGAETDFGLTALSELVALSGSLVIGIASVRGLASADALWLASRIDEDWEIEQWGVDAEAEAFATQRRLDFLQALKFHKLGRPMRDGGA